MGHLNDIGEGYFPHWLYAMRFGLVLILVGLAVMVHAFFPFWFKDTGSRAIRAMAKVIDKVDNIDKEEDDASI